MIAFVILHYRAIEGTVKCVESIQALKGEKHIVIVDSASPDGTGAQLQARYAGAPGVTVLLAQENLGYARGNNLGILYAWQQLRPDYIAAVNNDVEIFQEDFISRIGEIYARQPFDLLGPDILSVFSGIHQNPKSLEPCTLEAVRKKMASVRHTQKPIWMLLSSGQKNSPAIWRQVLRRKREAQGIDTSVPALGATLQGACVIFSRRYLEEHPEPFYPKTFMYYEMEILDWLCRREGNVVLYDPSIQIIHYQYMATKTEYRSILRRSKFVCACLMDSLRAAEELMLSAGEGEETEAERAPALTGS